MILLYYRFLVRYKLAIRCHLKAAMGTIADILWQR